MRRMRCVNTRKLATLFHVEPGEGRPVLLMLSASFFVGSSMRLAAAAYALFLAQFGGRACPACTWL